MNKHPKPIMQPQTFESLHAYSVPPHCRARSRHTMAEIKVIEPAKSIFISFCFHDRVDCFRFAGLYIVAIIKMARAPQAGQSAHAVRNIGGGATLTEVHPKTESPSHFCGIRKDSSK